LSSGTHLPRIASVAQKGICRLEIDANLDRDRGVRGFNEMFRKRKTAVLVKGYPDSLCMSRSWFDSRAPYISRMIFSSCSSRAFPNSFAYLSGDGTRKYMFSANVVSAII
jgi:hypothetical protein